MGDSILSSTLLFNPALRVSAEGALADKWVSEFHKSEEEPVYPDGPIRIVVSDNTKLSAADYRNNLYTQITAIKKEKRLRTATRATPRGGRNMHESVSDRSRKRDEETLKNERNSSVLSFPLQPRDTKKIVPRARVCFLLPSLIFLSLLILAACRSAPATKPNEAVAGAAALDRPIAVTATESAAPPENRP